MQAAKGLRVIEIGEGLSAPFAGLILAAQGAEVCQLRAGLDRRLNVTESAFFDRGRILLDDEPDLERLVELADVVLCDLHPTQLRARGLPIDADDLDAKRSRPGVLVAVTDLGLTGPHADYAMADITTWAAGGLAYVTRRPVSDADAANYSPVLAPARQPEVLGGLAAATAAMAGVRLARLSGRSVVADVSRQEVIAAMLHGIVPPFVAGAVVAGAPTGRLSGVGMLLPAADGHVYIRTVEAHQWASLLGWIGGAEWANEPWATDPAQRMANWSRIAELIGEWTSQHPRRWLYEDGQRHRVPVALPRELDEVLEADQLQAREVWQKVDVGGAVGVAPMVPMLQDAPVGLSASSSSAELEKRWMR